MFTTGLDVTIANVALPSIQRALHGSVSGLQWTVDTYTLVVACLLMLSGSLADRFGRRRIFQIGLAAFRLGRCCAAGLRRSARPSGYTASRVWTVLNEFVTAQDRRRTLRAALDLGPRRIELLIKLADGPMTLREIARALDMDPPAATVGVDHLETRGLVRRTPHPDDLRRKLVNLTDAGRDAAQRGQAILNEPPQALTNLHPDDLARLDEILTRLQTNRSLGR